MGGWFRCARDPASLRVLGQTSRQIGRQSAAGDASPEGDWRVVSDIQYVSRPWHRLASRRKCGAEGWGSLARTAKRPESLHPPVPQGFVHFSGHFTTFTSVRISNNVPYSSSRATKVDFFFRVRNTLYFVPVESDSATFWDRAQKWHPNSSQDSANSNQRPSFDRCC